MAIYLKSGDTSPPIRVALVQWDGSRVDLTGGSAVFKLRDPSGIVQVSGPAVITDAVHGELEYRWEGADTATPGEYAGQFVVTLADGRVRSKPQRGLYRIVIEQGVTA